MPKALTTIKKNRLRILEPKLDKAIMNADYQAAREIVHDIQSLGIEVYCERYRPLGLMEIRNQKVV